MAEANVELSRLPSFSSRSCCRRAAPCRLNSQFSQPQSLKPWPTQPNLPKFGHLPASFLLSRKALENRRSPLRRCHHRTPSTPTAVAAGKQGKESSLLYVPNHHDPHWANYHRISSVRPYSIQYSPFRFPKAGNM